MKKKLLAFMLILSLCLSGLAPLSSSYAATQGTFKSKLGNINIGSALAILEKIVDDDDNYKNEIESILAKLDYETKAKLHKNGFITIDSKTGEVVSYEKVTELLLALKDLVNGTEEENSYTIFNLIYALIDGNTVKSKAATKYMYSHIIQTLPENVVTRDLGKYGDTPEEKAEAIQKIFNDIHDENDKYISADSKGGIIISLPEGYLAKINSALAKYALEGRIALKFDESHIKAIEAVLNVLSKKINDSGCAYSALEIAEAMSMLNGNLDKEAPNEVIVDIDGKTSDSVKLYMYAEDKTGISHFEIYQDGVILKVKPTSNSYTVTGLSPQKTYKFQIRAVDLYGNTSALSEAVSVTTDKTVSGGGSSSGGCTSGGNSSGTSSSGGSCSSGTAGTGGQTSTDKSSNTVAVENKVANDAVKVTETEAKVTVQVDSAKFTAEVAKAVENLVSAAEKTSSGTDLIAKVVIPISQTSKDEIQVNIPVASLAKAMDKNVEVVLEAKGVEVSIPVQNIKTGFDNVSFEMKEVKETKELAQKINQKIEQTSAGAAEVMKITKVFTFDLVGTSSSGQTEKLDKSFDKKVKVTVDISDVVVNRDKAVLKFVDNDGSTAIVGKKIKDGKISAQLSHFSSYALIERDVKLTDVSSHWAKGAINSMASKGVVNGYDDMTFKPENNVTRAEFAKLIVEALELEIVKSTDSFNDVKGHWGANYIATAYENGIISGYDKYTFKPNSQITRAEMAAMLSRALGSNGADVDINTFTDASSIPEWAKDGVKGAVASDLIYGDTSGRFNPQKLTTRAESATVIYRLFNK